MTLRDAVIKTVKREIRDIHRACICEVLCVHKDKVRCDILFKFNSTNKKSHYSLYNVPIWYPKGGNSIILTPLKAGDTVLAIFTDFSANDSLIDHNIRTETDNQIEANSVIVLGGFILDTDIGATIDGVKVEVPDTLTILSDSPISISTPKIISSTLPTANDSHRGEIRLVAGGAGVRDNLYMCMKSNADTWSWRLIVAG
jgi:hypothetical protein